MTYDDLLKVCDCLGITAREKDLQAYDGRIKDKRVAIRRTIPTYVKKSCVLAEELGHFFTSSGDILDDKTESRKQELRAREWAYDVQIGLSGLVEAKTAGCRGVHEMAEYLNVTERFLRDCITRYHDKYGSRVQYRDFVIYFDPYFDIVALTDDMRTDDDQ